MKAAYSKNKGAMEALLTVKDIDTSSLNNVLSGLF